MCSNILMIFVFEDQFCSGHTQGIEVVPTDTGGSVTSNGELYGVISINNENRNRLFAIHTKVYAYLQFIRDVVGAALEN
ncbi:PREDICTED: trypsin-2-like [Ceratosolen solmsi marchali]|uniref:Trypsin-2-like n=1 Tax=Ceratosolen solmsi marchali TaxID=326594 RepID=A0AAJ7DUY8_9HYME|nr:PREDICTED: trypsin-2-like [Ceratosolen solmsi marchali]